MKGDRGFIPEHTNDAPYPRPLIKVEVSFPTHPDGVSLTLGSLQAVCDALKQAGADEMTPLIVSLDETGFYVVARELP